MKANIFTAADYADSSSGKLTIVGAFDNIELENCPSVFKPFGIAIKLIPETREYGKTYEGNLILRKTGSTKPLAKIQLHLNFSLKTHQKIGSLAMALNMVGAKFDSFGTYLLELKISSRTVASTKINVVKKTKANKTKKPKK